MKVAYIDGSAGASGDMLLGALLDSCIKLSYLQDILRKLNVSGVTLKSGKDARGGVPGTRLEVILTEDASQPRRWQEFVDIVTSSSLSDAVKDRSVAVFKVIGNAEAMVHGTDPEHVHLHELGTLDTLIDVVGVVAGFEKAGVKKIFSSALATGSGTVHGSHGVMTVPVPATLAILSLSNSTFYPPKNSSPHTGEMLTPTGAALISTLAEFAQPVIKLETYGFGLGSRDPLEYPNALSLTLGELIEQDYASSLVLLETNLDDTTGEILGFVQERLFSIGARDVWFTPIQMKKNRPATILSVLADDHLRSKVEETIFKETSTLGIRIKSVNRVEANREIRKFQSSYGIVSIKISSHAGEIFSVSPEYDDCRSISLKEGLPIANVMRQIKNEAEDSILC
jgi:uncharacterized protein (TIGR00299 family) protein